MLTTKNYEKIWFDTESLTWCALVTTGRVGSDFFQSLLDSHPQIFIINGPLIFYDFWEKASTINNTETLYAEDIIEEFIGYHIVKFKSYYDFQERKNELGEDRNQSININIDEYKFHLKNLLRFGPLTSKSFLKAIYLSWAICMKEDLAKKKIFFHHIHHIWRLDRFLVDYPNSKILAMTRDPRASYVSGVENWFKYSSLTKHPGHVFFVLKRTINDASYLENFQNDFRVLKLEDLGKEKILSQFCDWVGIKYDSCMNNSTWNGLRWWGDKLSQQKIKPNETGFSNSITKNKWNEKLGTLEKLTLKYLLLDRLNWYRYENNIKTNMFLYFCIFILIPIPTKYERMFLSIKSIFHCLKDRKLRIIFASIYYYFLRVSLFYSLLFPIKKKKKFNLPYFKEN